MKINVICLGKLKENYLKKAESEYVKRISGYSSVKVTELKDFSQAKNMSDDMIRKKEAELVLPRIEAGSLIAVLDIDGRQMSSEEFASFIDESCIRGKSSFTFIIGSSVGLDESVKKRADLRLSFSKMTFPHQLFRVMLLEQIYRAMKINANETYHK